MSTLGNIQRAVGAVKSLSSLFPSALGGAGASWRDQLRPASFGGVPFGVLGGQIRVGRRNAVHEYPFKDQVWVEDLGRAARRITLTGFLVENGIYGGGNVIAQRERLIAVCESAGKSTLVHPTLGMLNVSLLDSMMEERWDRGRVFEISFAFIEAGERVFPELTVDTGAEVSIAASLADAAGISDFASSVTSSLAQGAAVVNMAVSTASAWASKAVGLANNATNLMSMVGLMPGSFGRFVGGRSNPISGLSKIVTTATSVSQLIAQGSVARSAVSTASSALSKAASLIAL
ncbi:DNA circularization N-terminal domain-containing protein [Variovorax sp. N23]|uniref:DNA circularization N-terminal domain-containing protein n=1 Tax=Variovorax sp. N23 TaxID=2980555 RepID=UPI0021C8B2CC|nr:DNA circularization N-terminal domain-containing protein [Variovorax sp. N23]MCU4119297.1 DNA circularization N-terminal domain-containing protein [Variovorax sp. N23]